MSYKQTIISSAIAMNVFSVKTSYFIFQQLMNIFQQLMKRGSYMSILGSKGQRSTFRRLSGCTYFLTGYLNTSRSVFLPTLKKSESALLSFANFSVLCQVGHFTYALCYQFLMVFRCFGIFPLDRTGFCHLHNTRK